VKNTNYYNQSFPTNIPQEFLRGIISTDQHEHSSPTISVDGKECYWSMMRLPLGETPQRIKFSNFDGEKWTSPQLASFSSSHVDGGPVFSFDNQHLYFYSKRPVDGVGHPRIWVVDRYEKGWGEPHLALGEEHADLIQFSFSFTKSGTFYILGIMQDVKNNMGIYRIRQNSGVFDNPEPLPSQINSVHQDWIPFIAPDESYLIFSSDRPGCIGDFDLYISFHNENDQWSEPLNLGPTINTEGSERFPGLTPDEKALFFVRESEIYWVDSGFIEKLRKKK
jgi:Tol biopolymer transport system component